MTNLSCEQQDIVAAPLSSVCVIACAGSGKTRTAVYRLEEIRKRLSKDRARIALLSFANTAIDTFRKDYAALATDGSGRRRVEIDTVDGFITTNVLRPHGYRTMGSPVTAYLVLGSEQFLQGFKFNTGTFPQSITQIQVGFREGQPHFYYSY